MKLRQRYPFPDSKKLSPLFAFNSSYLAYVVDSCVELVEYGSVSQKVVRLDGHKKAVRCLKFAKDRRASKGAAARIEAANHQLCTCSQDRVVVWNLDSSSGSFTSKIVAQNLRYEPSDCSFHPVKNVLAVSNGSLLSLIDLETSVLSTCKALTVLFEIEFNDHLSSIEFCSFNWDLICIINKSNVLQVFDTSKRQVAYQVRAESINNVFTADSQPVLVATTTDGQLKVYEVTSYDLRLKKSLKLDALFREYKKRVWSSMSDQDEFLDPSMLCIGADLFTLESNTTIKFENKSTMTSDSGSKLVLIYGTTSYMMAVDLELDSLMDLHDWKQSQKLDETLFIPHVMSFCSNKNGDLSSAVLSIFQNQINVLQIAQIEPSKPIEAGKPQPVEFKSHSVLLDEAILTVFPQMNLLDDSPLKSAAISSNEATSRKNEKAPSMQEYLKQASTLKKSQSTTSLQTKPLTFNSKIKSSGYNSQPRKDRFAPLINKKSSSNLSNLQTLNKNIEAAMKNADKKAQASKKPEFKFQLPTTLAKKLNADDNRKPVVHLKFTDDGQSLLLATTDHVIQLLQSKGLDKTRTYLNGHKDQIRSIDASHDGSYILSCSDDKTCKIWSLKKPNNLLLDVDSFSTATQKHVPFQKEILSANFFYMDNFILIGTENKFHTFKYSIDTNKNDVQRYLTNSVFKRVAQMELMAAQNLVCMSAINSFFSYLVLCGGSDKSIEIFDMNQAKSCLLIKDAHSRVFHQIVQNGSQYNAHSYDLFLTNAVGDGVKLWDMRMAQCTMKFENHVNRCLPKSVSFSPDSNYIAAGSEDRSLLVYDLRTGSVVDKYGTFSDTVSCVQINPQRSQIVLGTQDGNIYEYATSKIGTTK